MNVGNRAAFEGGTCGRLAELGYGDGGHVRVVGVWEHESAFPRYEVTRERERE